MVLNGTIDKEMGSITYAQKREQVADEIIFMDEGKIVELGTYDDFFNNPQPDRAKLFLSQILD